MLPKRHRVRTPADFSQTLRSGSRSGRRNVVVSAFSPTSTNDGAAPVESGPNRVGFIVSKAVGNAVVRNRVKRRLRAIAAAELSVASGHLLSDSNTAIVIRALPASASASWSELKADVSDGLESALKKAERRG